MRSQLRTAGILMAWVVMTGVFWLAGRGAAGEEAPSGMMARKNVMVPMRDGIKLATDIYLPASGGAVAKGPIPGHSQPHALRQGRQPRAMRSTTFLAATSWSAQDTRGRGESEGIWHWMTDDRQDGYDAIEWIAGSSPGRTARSA